MSSRRLQRAKMCNISRAITCQNVCAAYHHNWTRNDLSQLVHAFVAGHFIECGTYVTGGNFSGFKTLPPEMITNIGFPIATIETDGVFTISKQKSRGGIVTVDTCKAQLLYEKFYYNSDVMAKLDRMKIEQVGPDGVIISYKY
ncbi:hypothetical protein LTR37_019700 [Vermiconidia calcicola]|uniref:Uncharacterized protein n=1 Tax=Vermiconidia calcicola TaxID=1690605 RepID=A0ACC3MDF3_9PEZI|nr:hypothetical protein LTR37_019700 [Vermiconidia calcicola]